MPLIGNGGLNPSATFDKGLLSTFSGTLDSNGELAISLPTGGLTTARAYITMFSDPTVQGSLVTQIISDTSAKVYSLAKSEHSGVSIKGEFRKGTTS